MPDETCLGWKVIDWRNGAACITCVRMIDFTGIGVAVTVFFRAHIFSTPGYPPIYF